MRSLVEVVEDAEWVSQFDAADHLGVGVFRIGSLIANDHLVPAENPNGLAGVTRTSVEVEREWRASASLLQRLRRLVSDALNWV